MTVKELIKLLEEMPSDVSVSLEGCDCEGEARGVEIVRFTDYKKVEQTYVLIRRIP